MRLKVVGAGFGRTGTLSLKKALERLGFAPCYHMFEVVERPDHIQRWHRLAFERAMDWETLFSDFQSTVDWPAARFWHQLASDYPDAKVLLSVRDPEDWYKSMSSTIFEALQMPIPAQGSEAQRQQMEMARKLVLQDTFGGNVNRDHAIKVFNRHNETVKSAFDTSRLLVFDVRKGWEPLCHFLGVQIPDEAFPRLNDTTTIRAMMKQMRESERT
jgi:hypothetical protein